MKTIDNLVIGAGIAGLGAAHDLQKRGLNVLLVEKELGPGGRMVSNEIDGLRVDTGAKFIASFYQNINQLAEELQLEMCSLQFGEIGIKRDAKVYSFNPHNIRSIFQLGLISNYAKLKLILVFLRTLLDSRKVNLFHLEKSLDIDKEGLEPYLKRIGGEEVYNYILDPICQSFFFYGPQDFSKIMFLGTLPKLLTVKYKSFTNGIGALTEKLARTLNIDYGVEVKLIKRVSDGVEVQMAKGTNIEWVKAKRVIIAVPGNKVLELLDQPENYEREYFSGIEYVDLASVYFKGTTNLLDATATVWFPRSQSKTFSALSKVDLNSKDFFNVKVRESALNDVQTNKRFLEESISKELSVKDVKVERIVRWSSAIPKLKSEHIRKTFEFKSKRPNNSSIFYCGDYLESPSTEGALTSGLEVAKKILNQAGVQPGFNVDNL